MKRLCLVIVMGMMLCLLPCSFVQAEDIDYDSIQEAMDDVLNKDENFSFQKYVEDLVTGKEDFSLDAFVSKMKDSFLNEFSNSKDGLLRLFLIGIVAAILSNFSTVFGGKDIAETAFYITYMLLFTILTSAFLSVAAVASSALKGLLTFTKVLMPSFCISVAMTGNIGSSTLFYESTIAAIALVDAVLVNLVLPAIQIYFLLMLVNNISEIDRFSKFAELIKSFVMWTIKTLFGIVIGFHTIQGLIIPMVDKVKGNVLLKTAGSIPGVGGAVSNAAETVIGTAMLIKSAIGVAGIIVIIIICLVPLVKILIFTFLYRLGAAVLQPISDKRITSCIHVTATAGKMLLFAVGIGAMLFLFSIAIITAVTNG